MGNVILALDLGTKTGWAVSRSGQIFSGVENFTPTRFDGGGMRFVRFIKFLDDLHLTTAIERVYFEEVRRHTAVTAAHVYGGFWSHLGSWCETHSIPYQGVPVQTIKKHATGKGNASKEDVIRAVKKRGFNPKDDNEADAIALLFSILS